MSVVRYGVIGCGMMGREHMRNVALVPGARLVGICDPDEGSREAARVLEELDNLLELGFGLVHPGDVASTTISGLGAVSLTFT